MAKAGSTPIEFNAKAWLISAALSALLAVVGIISAVKTGQAAVLFLTVFWGGISIYCARQFWFKR